MRVFKDVFYKPSKDCCIMYLWILRPQMELIQVGLANCEFLHTVPRVGLQCPYYAVKIMIGTDLRSLAN